MEKDAYILPSISGGFDNRAATDDRGATVPSRSDAPVITVQPFIYGAGQVRAPIPVPTLTWRSTDTPQLNPMSGLDFLLGPRELSIQQTVELEDMGSEGLSENRYTVRAGAAAPAEALYLATESSSARQRLLWGSGRALTLRLHDVTRQEALVLSRRLAASCWLPCRLQEMKVISPPGNYVGRVRQQWTTQAPLFLVQDDSHNVLYLVEGPPTGCCANPVDIEFQILDGESLAREGAIAHCWDRHLSNFTTTVSFPSRATEPRHKALLLAAAFLLEYTFFEKSKNKRWYTCNCL